MKLSLKIFLGFLAIWLVWYFTGGPQRAASTKPYVKYNYDTTQIEKSDTDLEQGAKDMLPIDTASQSVEIIKTNLQDLQNQNFTN